MGKSIFSKSIYFTAIGSSSVKTVAGMHGIAVYPPRRSELQPQSGLDGQSWALVTSFSGGINIVDLERPWIPNYGV